MGIPAMRRKQAALCCAAISARRAAWRDPALHKALGIVTVLRISSLKGAIVTGRLPGVPVFPGGC
jgi:hypothetical protein